MAEKRRAGLGRMAASRQGTHRKTETISLKNRRIITFKIQDIV